MRMLVRLVLGLVVLKVVVSSPRHPRQAELDTYDSANYDVDLENLNGENYDYEDGLTIDEPQIEIGTLAPLDYNYPEPGASLEEEEEEGAEEEEVAEEEEEEVPEEEEEVYVEEMEEVEQELPNIPSQVVPPRGSEGSGILMGPATQKEEELRLTPLDILHISGDFGGSAGSGAASGASVGSAGGSGGSRDLLASGSGGSGELLGSGGSGDLASGISGAFSGDLGSGASGDLGSRGSGISGEFGSGTSGDTGSGVSGASGDLGSGASGASGDFPVASGISGDYSGSASGGSGGSGIILIPEEEELPLIPEVPPQEASGASGESGASGFSGASGSGASGESGQSGEESGEPEVPIVPDLIPGEEELLPTTPETPQEVEGEGSTESGDVDVEPDVDVDIDRTGMATCLLCTCLGGSVYCDDLKLDTVPPLPKETTHFYARYNRITKIRKSDFAQMNKLQRIDVTANEISSIEDNAFSGLPALKELVIRENGVAQLPALPTSMTLVDASHNNIGATGIHKEAFKDMSGLLYLYLTDNHIDHIPVPLPDSLRSLHLQRNNIQMMHEDTFCNLHDFNYIRNALEDIRLDGNPLNLSRTPQAYVCLPRMPIGDLI